MTMSPPLSGVTIYTDSNHIEPLGSEFEYDFIA